MTLVVLVDGLDRLHARVVVAAEVGLRLIGLVPVEDTTDEGRDQRHAGIGTGLGLGEAEQQRQVGADAFALELLGGANAFPGGGGLDQDAFLTDAIGGVALDDAVRATDGLVGIEGQTGADLGGDIARHQAGDLGTDIHGHGIDGIIDVGSLARDFGQALAT